MRCSVAAGCAEIWDVGSDKLEEQRYEGLWKLTLLCACMQIVPLAFIQILPGSEEEQVPCPCLFVSDLVMSQWIYIRALCTVHAVYP